MRAALHRPDLLEPRRLLSNAAEVPVAVGPVKPDDSTATTWYVESGFVGPSNGSQADPFTTIQSAIDSASPGDTILVETGVGYDESDTIGVANLTIEAAPGASPVFEGSMDVWPWNPAFTVTAGGVTISGMTIQGEPDVAVQIEAGGSATIGDCSIEHDGVGIANYGGVVAILDDTIQDDQTGVSIESTTPSYLEPITLLLDVGSPSTVPTPGGTTTITGSTILGSSEGGITNDDGTVSVTDTTISDNQGSGGIDNESGSVTLTDCTISVNSAANGGGIDNQGTMTIDGGTVAGNSATTGGGLANLGDLTVSGGEVVDDVAVEAGGGLDNEAGTATLTGVTIANNVAGGSGGGIANLATIGVSGGTVADNSAARGGGLDNDGTMTLANTQVTGNATVGSAPASEGGGIDNGAGTLTVTGGSISGNSAGTGGGLYNDFGATANVDSGTISGNSAGTGGADIANDGTMNVESSSIAADAARAPGGFIRNDGGKLSIVDSRLSSRVRHGIVREGGKVDLAGHHHRGSRGHGSGR